MQVLLRSFTPHLRDSFLAWDGTWSTIFKFWSGLAMISIAFCAAEKSTLLSAACKSARNPLSSRGTYLVGWGAVGLRMMGGSDSLLQESKSIPSAVAVAVAIFIVTDEDIPASHCSPPTNASKSESQDCCDADRAFRATYHCSKIRIVCHLGQHAGASSEPREAVQGEPADSARLRSFEVMSSGQSEVAQHGGECVCRTGVAPLLLKGRWDFQWSCDST